MKRILLIPLALAALAGSASANPACLTGGTLDFYISTYNNLANACSIGDKLFYGFSYSATAGGGATPVAANLIHVAGVISDPLDPGIQFQVGGYFASSGQTKDGTIGYSILTDDTGLFIDDADLRIVGSITRGTGSITGTEHLLFSGTSTDINPGSPIVDSIPASAFTHINFADFGGANLHGFDVTTALHVGADANSFATLSAVEEHFSQVDLPEPCEALLAGFGLLLIGGMKKWRTRAGRPNQVNVG